MIFLLYSIIEGQPTVPNMCNMSYLNVSFTSDQSIEFVTQRNESVEKSSMLDYSRGMLFHLISSRLYFDGFQCPIP